MSERGQEGERARVSRRRVYGARASGPWVRRPPLPAEQSVSRSEILPVLLGMPDELGAGLGVTANKIFEEAINLCLKSVVKFDQRSKLVGGVTGRHVPFLGKAKEKCFNSETLQIRKLLH
jgi:hypothetical protein